MARFKSKKLIIIVIIIILVGMGMAAATRAARAGNQGTPVEVAVIAKGDIVVKVPANGVLEEVEKQLVYYEGSSKVKSIEVELGQRVTKGQLLAIVDATDLKSKIDVAGEQQEIERITLERLEMSRVEAIDSSKSLLTEARLTLERNQELFDRGAISQVELEKLQKSCDDAERTYQQYLNNEDSLYYDIQKLHKQLNISRLNINDLLAQQQKQSAQIVSPMEGVVTQQNIELGGFTSPTSPCFVISNMEHLEIKIDVSEYDIAKVHIGQEVEIVTDAMGDKIFKGTVEKIAPVASRVNTGQSVETVVGVTIKVMETNEFLKPGFSVKTRIISESSLNTIVVPFDAIQTENEGARFVYVVKDGIVAKREVQVGVESDFTIEVVSNLTEGEEVIVNPPDNLADGDKVLVIAKK